MAVDAPKGLVPVRRTDGQPLSGAVRKYVISSSDSVNVFIGDIVYHTGSSPTTGARILGEDVSGIPLVAKVSTSYATNALPKMVGVVVGVKPNPDNLARKYRAASTDAILYVMPAQGTVFEIQEDADTTPIVAASIGLNADIIWSAGVGSTTTGVSALELDSTSVASTATLPLHIVGLSKKLDNDFYAGNGSVNAKFLVTINNPATDGDVGGDTVGA